MIVELTNATFHEVVDNAPFAVVDCYGDFCFACELLAPVYDGLAAKMPAISFCRLNTTAEPEIAMELGVFDLPTVLYYRNGELITQSAGSMDEEELKVYLAEMLYSGIEG